MQLARRRSGPSLRNVRGSPSRVAVRLTPERVSSTRTPSKSGSPWVQSENNKKYTPFTMVVLPKTVVSLFFELKNEIGTGDADATHQICIAMLVAEEVHHLFLFTRVCLPARQDRNHASCCSTFLLVLMGSWLFVLGAVFTNSSTVQPLTPLLWLGDMHGWIPQYAEVTRIFAVLSMDISELEEFYSHLDLALISEARFFPYITSFAEGNTGRKVQSDYETYADPNPDGKKVVHCQHRRRSEDCCQVYRDVQRERPHPTCCQGSRSPASFLRPRHVRKSHHGRHGLHRWETVIR